VSSGILFFVSIVILKKINVDDELLLMMTMITKL